MTPSVLLVDSEKTCVWRFQRLAEKRRGAEPATKLLVGESSDDGGDEDAQDDDDEGEKTCKDPCPRHLPETSTFV
jgi:hypothetical protein